MVMTLPKLSISSLSLLAKSDAIDIDSSDSLITYPVDIHRASF